MKVPRSLIGFCFLAFAIFGNAPLLTATEVEVMPRDPAYPKAQAVAAADQSDSPVPKARHTTRARSEDDEDDDATPAPKGKRSARSRTAAGTPITEPPRPTGGPPSSGARSVMMINAGTGQVLYEKNADEQRAAASTQKLLTALIVAEHGFLDRPVTVEQVDTMAEPVKLNIRPGDTYQRIELLRALLVKSPNDVARCLARDQAGSCEAFATVMNEKARELGATHSHFVNPNGLPVPNQYSSARDLSIIAKAAYANAVIRSIVCMPRLMFRYANGRMRELENTNKVLGRSPYCNGMKTGYTEAAGHCLICSGSRPGRDIIVVVLGDSKAGVWRDASALLAWGLWL